jgi:hypothetical protein
MRRTRLQFLWFNMSSTAVFRTLRRSGMYSTSVKMVLLNSVHGKTPPVSGKHHKHLPECIVFETDGCTGQMALLRHNSSRFSMRTPLASRYVYSWLILCLVAEDVGSFSSKTFIPALVRSSYYLPIIHLLIYRLRLVGTEISMVYPLTTLFQNFADFMA